MDNEELSRRLIKELDKVYPEQTDKIFNHKYCDIDGEFLGFLEPYYYLAKIIPKKDVVYDFGCAFAPQSWYFRNHKKYVGICPSGVPHWEMPNSEFHIMTAQEFLDKYLDTEVLKKVSFAICNAVPDWKAQEQIKMKFQNVFNMYPH